MNMKITHPLMFSFFMVFLIVSISLATTTEDIYTAIQNARRDAGQAAYTAIQNARRDAAADTGSIWYFGGLATFLTAFTTGEITPTPPTSRFLGKSYEYIRVYNREYEKAVNNLRLRKSVVGGCIGSVVIVGCGLILGQN